MNQHEKDKAIEIINEGVFRLVEDYSDNALLINACHVARDRYQNIGPQFERLSTTRNIPTALRLETELDMTYDANELVAKYSGDLNEVVCTNYIVTTVSIVDAVLEDLYEYLVKLNDPGLSDSELEKIVRNAWTNENMLNFLCDPSGLNLKKPTGLNTEFREAFMRYSELRIIRHTLLHTDKRLSSKNQTKLQDYLDQTPAERKHFALINAPFFDADKRISLTTNHILSIRKYAYTFLMYIRNSIEELTVVN